MQTIDGLAAVLERTGPVIVAFSGGVDSALLAKVAHDTLGPGRAVAVTAVSASLAPSELDDCRRLAAEWGLDWRTVETDEATRPAYLANGGDRCYHCKSSLMDGLAPVAAEVGATVVLGVNLDDLGDHRPGQRAAAEAGARFPYVEAGMGKDAVRAAARALGLDVWDKPAAACLASRIPYGTPVTLGTLSKVAEAEAALHGLGLRQLRVRHYGDLARIEVDVADLDRVVALRAEVVEALRRAGYSYVTVDLEGFRSGNLNAALGV